MVKKLEVESKQGFSLQAPVICVVGPTASGKSELAQRIAESIHAEIISADSMQVYRHMDIGTGKVVREQQRVVHHGLDLVEPDEAFSAALFQEYARRCFKEIESRGLRSILCGGTGFYVRAAIDDYEFPAGEQVDNPIRIRFNTYAEENGAEALWTLLNERDAPSASVIHPNDVKRMVRAFELLEEGKSYAAQKEALSKLGQLVPALFIGLSVDRETLRERIDKRVDEMFEAGLVDEVSKLLDSGFRDAITAPQAIGYKEIVAALDGRCSMQEARESIKTATKRYAKRQRTWFNKDPRIHWIDATALNLDDMLSQSLRLVATI